MNLGGLEPGWLWLIGGVVLLIAELIAPGFFLVFVGVAALATGLFTLMFDLGAAPQLALFALYSLIAVMVGRRVYASAETVGSSDPLLNDRAARLVGRSVTVIQEVDEHSGRVRVGDSEWSARGGAATVGTRVRITGVEGNCLLVEPEYPQVSQAGDMDGSDTRLPPT
jgi:membrane protein implicated in regulation of membrane protease activity